MKPLQYSMVITAFSASAAFANLQDTDAQTAENTPLPAIEYSSAFFDAVCDRLKNVYLHYPDNRITLGTPVDEILADKNGRITYSGYENSQYDFLKSSLEGSPAQYVLVDEPNKTVCFISKETFEHYKP